MSVKRKCTECAWLARQDAGYSNYTVEETELICLLRLNPALPATESYSHETEQSIEMQFADKCPRFLAGDGPHFDVDREEGALSNYTKVQQVKVFLKMKHGSEEGFNIADYAYAGKKRKRKH